MEYKDFKEKSHYKNSTVYLMDCMDALRQTPNNYYSLALVDPPYGIGEDGLKNHSRVKATKPTLYIPKEWDKSTPDNLYFDEIIRVSKKSIIWGANHFIENIPLANSSSWIVWDKLNGDNDFADCELAWTNHKSAVRKYVFRWAGMLQGDMKNKENRIHPTQKPVALYSWIYHNYLPQGGKVFDSHLGSGSNRISADKAGNIDFYATEIDKDYFEAQEKRWRNYKAQLTMF